MEILLYTEDPAIELRLRAALAQNYTLRQITSSRQLAAALLAAIATAIMLDGKSADTEGLCLWLHNSVECPIFVIAAGDEAAERVRFLRAGADDVLAPACQCVEIIARLQAKLRRTAANQARYTSGRSSQIVPRPILIRGLELHLSPTELHLLAALQSHVGTFVSTDELLQEIWGTGAQPGSLRYHILQLRRRLSDIQDTLRIENRRGRGYRLVVQPDALC